MTLDHNFTGFVLVTLTSEMNVSVFDNKIYVGPVY